MTIEEKFEYGYLIGIYTLMESLEWDKKLKQLHVANNFKSKCPVIWQIFLSKSLQFLNRNINFE